MFTDLLNIPINSDRDKIQDQILTLSGMSWSDYEKVINREDYSYKIDYFNGVITIVSPSINHEIIERTISILIHAYCRKYKLLYFPMGSTTLKNSPIAGKEPDTSYSFETRKAIPDLAVEVIYSSGSVADLKKYQYLNVKEVWLWKKNEITFYHLVNSEYKEIKNSVYLPKLSADFLIAFINRGLTETPLIIEDDFYQQLN